MLDRKRVSSRYSVLVALVFCAIFSSLSLAAEPVVERLGVPGPIRFGQTEFELAWSSNPSPELFKQEYLPAGQNAERYQSMLMLDVRPTGANAAQMAAGMVEQLNARKATDPVVNYDLLLKPDGSEALLDFVLSAADPASGMLVEWNAYRYMTGADGGTVMLGISRRAYGDTEVRALVGALKESRARDIAELSQMQVPQARPSAP